jgi:hypothetical protein
MTKGGASIDMTAGANKLKQDNTLKGDALLLEKFQSDRL